ncbi:MAG TPA: hypothetical protein VFC21_05430, partial [Bryobacteraceae bacterium]|nr:hypothetical protein [Bryobacteraceae bacterium]
VPALVVTGGASSLTPPFAGIGKAGGARDITNVTPSAAYVIPSGQSVDIGLTGGGIDGTVSLRAIGQGISVHPGSVHVEPNISFGGQPLVRATLDIAAVKTPTLASVILTKGSSVLSMSGVLVLVPPTPTFSTNAVSNAASFKGTGVVSPGELASIYDSTGGSLGPDPYVQNTAFDLYGNLPNGAAGVSVTFDGILAPIYLAYAKQLNVQVPFEVAGKTSTQVVVNYYGSKSAPVTLAVAPAQPAFFTATAGGNDSIIQNFPDNSLNSGQNPIARGGFVTIYGTGIGMPYPLGTGQQGVVPPTGYTSASASCSFGGQSAAAYAYWVFGLVGEASWTVQVPSGSPTGTVALTCTDPVSGASTQPGTVYIK